MKKQKLILLSSVCLGTFLLTSSLKAKTYTDLCLDVCDLTEEFVATSSTGTYTDACSSCMLSKAQFVSKIWGLENATISDYQCYEFNLPETACIGNGLCSQDGNQGVGVSKGKRDQHAVLLLVAHEIADHGAKFCATQVQAIRNSLVDRPWLRYHLPNNDTRVCFWVCSDGYGGEGCSVENAQLVDNTILSQSAFSDLKLSVDDSTNVMKVDFNKFPEVKNDVFFFTNPGKYKCNAYKTEHNAFFGVVSFTSDGHGVITKPMVARVGYHTGAEREADIHVATIFDSLDGVLCLSGYHPEGDKCVLNDGIANQNQNNNQNGTILPCKGWEGLPNSASYVKYYTKGMNCYQYRCKDEAQGFSSNTNLTCVACNDSVQKGVNSDGVCITCEGTQIFDKETKQCRMSVEVTKQELAYGKTGSPALNVSDQCWTKLERSEYVRCVNGLRVTATPIKEYTAESYISVDKTIPIVSGAVSKLSQ